MRRKKSFDEQAALGVQTKEKGEEFVASGGEFTGHNDPF